MASEPPVGLHFNTCQQLQISGGALGRSSWDEKKPLWIQLSVHIPTCTDGPESSGTLPSKRCLSLSSRRGARSSGAREEVRAGLLLLSRPTPHTSTRPVLGGPGCTSWRRVGGTELLGPGRADEKTFSLQSNGKPPPTPRGVHQARFLTES